LPRAGGLKIPVLIYVVVLFLMGWQALELWSFSANKGIYTCVGGLLFMVSDSALGWNRFRGPFPFSSLVVLGTYFPAQFFLASSI
ncbi:lysoplasmalogenase, partial [bacterium]|nr:lysoplasmalogenase [bacterium]